MAQSHVGLAKSPQEEGYSRQIAYDSGQPPYPPLPPNPPKDYAAAAPTSSMDDAGAEDSWVKNNYLDQVAAAAEAKYGGFLGRNSKQASNSGASYSSGFVPYPSSQRSAADFSAYSSQPVYYDPKMGAGGALSSAYSSQIPLPRSSASEGPARNGATYKTKRDIMNQFQPALVGSPPPGAQPYSHQPAAGSRMMSSGSQGMMPMQPYTAQPAFGLGVGKYGNEIPSPLDAEIQHTMMEMQQELAYINSLSHSASLRHSRRLLKERCAKLESTVDPDWVEVDISKPIKVTKRVLVPTFRHSTFNYVGRILGPKGTTLQNICKKFKCFISVMGAASTKDRSREIELLNSGDPRFAHYASPLHVRIDTVAPAHIAHMRMAACLNVFHKLLIPGKDVYIEGITMPIDRPAIPSYQNQNEFDTEEQELLENELKLGGDGNGVSSHANAAQEYDDEDYDELEELRRHEGTSGNGHSAGGPIKSSRGIRGGTASGRGTRGGGFVPRGRPTNRGSPY